jgi:hypothetical protein
MARRYYNDDEMARRYQPTDRMPFSRGAHVMTAETAHRAARDLVDLDRESGTYRRVQMDPALETLIINEAAARSRLLKPMEDTGNRPAALR